MQRLDAPSVAVGVAVGLVTSACVALAVRWAAGVEQSPARRRRTPLEPADPRGETMVAKACAAAIGPRAIGRGGSIPVPVMDMASLMGVVLRPPLDERVATMLESTSLCYLSTFSLDQGEPSPHLSLVRFTYVRGEEVVLVSTNRRTKRCAHVQGGRGRGCGLAASRGVCSTRLWARCARARARAAAASARPAVERTEAAAGASVLGRGSVWWREAARNALLLAATWEGGRCARQMPGESRRVASRAVRLRLA
jgi:hypothetical protein